MHVCVHCRSDWHSVVHAMSDGQHMDVMHCPQYKFGDITSRSAPPHVVVPDVAVLLGTGPASEAGFADDPPPLDRLAHDASGGGTQLPSSSGSLELPEEQPAKPKAKATLIARMAPIVS